MGFDAHGGYVDDDWDRVWRDYDNRRPAPRPIPAQPVVSPMRVARSPKRGHGAILALACCLILAPKQATQEAGRYPSAAEAVASLMSLAPEEAELPPLTAAISRLAAESATAACWVMRLAPSGPGCAAP